MDNRYIDAIKRFQMKTAEEILLKNAPVFEQGFDPILKNLVIKAMQEYAEQQSEFWIRGKFSEPSIQQNKKELIERTPN